MRILNIGVMNGPNVWSTYRKKLVVMKLDLEEMEARPTNKIEGFLERLKALMPSLYEHRCSEDHKGGFFHRVQEGTWLGHVVEHIALELQSLGGIEVGYGRTRSTSVPGVYNVVFSYDIKSAGVYAAKAAVRIAEALTVGEAYDLETDIAEIRRIKSREGLGPSTLAIVEEAHRRGIPYRRLNDGSFVVFGQGIYQKKILATMTSATSSIAVDIACDKDRTKSILSKAFIPVPQGVVIDAQDQLADAIAEVGWPLVVKPLDGNQGRGITINITTPEQAATALHHAQEISDDVVIEKYIPGDDYRFLVVNYKLVAAARRTPAMVKGDGKSTIAQLIDIVNSDPKRGDGHDNVLTKITVDRETQEILDVHGKTLETILQEGDILYLKKTANLSTGGTSCDVTDEVHPYNKVLAERIARLVGLDICGIDIVAEGVDEPITEDTGAIVEVNAAPGFRMHLCPGQGTPRNVAAPVIDMLYPAESPSRIPVIAVTGTNGKTTTVRLISHIAQSAGYTVGSTTTDGIYLNGVQVHSGDCSGPRSAIATLLDPTVEMAVLECARGGILKSGLGFDQCDVGIVTNVSEDHLGLKDIHTLADMARVKAVVPASVSKDGYAILNADDDHVYAMGEDLDCEIALFSLDCNNERLLAHCDAGGLAATIENGHFIICRGKWHERVEKVEHVPITLGGTADPMIKNILPAILAASVRGFSLQTIRDGLHTFLPTPENNPGRYNIFSFGHFDVMIDYAHNTDGMRALGKFLATMPERNRVGIFAGVGDRRDEDIIAMGHIAAEIFDEIIIRQDEDLRGRTREEIVELLMVGIRSVKPDQSVTFIDSESEAILHAVDTAGPGTFISVCTDDPKSSITQVRELLHRRKLRAPMAGNEQNVKVA